jgi:hypothetical protein
VTSAGWMGGLEGKAIVTRKGRSRPAGTERMRSLERHGPEASPEPSCCAFSGSRDSLPMEPTPRDIRNAETRSRIARVRREAYTLAPRLAEGKLGIGREPGGRHYW